MGNGQNNAGIKQYHLRGEEFHMTFARQGYNPETETGKPREEGFMKAENPVLETIGPH